MHYPVLLKEIISIISPQYGGTFIDCTFGQGGYSKKILEFNNTKVIAIDRDSESEKKRNLREVIEHQIGDYPENWVSSEIALKELAPYIYPNEDELKKKKVTAYYFSHFFKWSMLENYNFVKKDNIKH